MCGLKSAALTIELSSNIFNLCNARLLQYCVAGEVLERSDVTGFVSIMFY